MNNDSPGDAAVWRALFGGAQSPFLLLICVLVTHIVKEPPKGFTADNGSDSGDGRNFRCCTVGELLRDCGCVSVMTVQEMCDEKGGRRT